MSLHIYIYIEREGERHGERERESERESERETATLPLAGAVRQTLEEIPPQQCGIYSRI